jgi:hypothetical protein
MGISFQLKEESLEIYRPDSERFLTPVEINQLRLQKKQLAQAQAEQERQRAE